MKIPAIIGKRWPSKIDERLWQGGYPLNPTDVGLAGVDVLVLAAEELQPSCPRETEVLFPDVRVICAPIADDGYSPPSPREQRDANIAATLVAQALREDKTVLTTCAAGLNRSGLVNALALVKHLRISGLEAVARVREGRPDALRNLGFVDFLSKISAKIA